MRLVRRYIDLVARWHWSLLLGLLIAAMVFDAAAGPGPVADLAGLALHTLILVGTLGTASLPEGWKRAGYLLVGLWTAMALARILTGAAEIDTALIALSAAITLGALVVTYVELFLRRTDTLDALAGSVFGYFLLALTWGLLYRQIEAWQPGAFSLAEGDPGPQFTYFSLVTLTTLGYGEIVPVAPLARVASGLEAAFGTLYVAIFVGRIVARMQPTDRGLR